MSQLKLLVIPLILLLLLSVQSCRLKESRAEAEKYQSAYLGSQAALALLQDELKYRDKILTEREQERNATQTELLKAKEQIASLLSGKQDVRDWHSQPMPPDIVQLLNNNSDRGGQDKAAASLDAANSRTTNNGKH